VTTLVTAAKETSFYPINPGDDRRHAVHILHGGAYVAELVHSGGRIQFLWFI